MPVRTAQALGGNTQKISNTQKMSNFYGARAGPLSARQSREPLHKLLREFAGSILDLPMITEPNTSVGVWREQGFSAPEKTKRCGGGGGDSSGSGAPKLLDFTRAGAGKIYARNPMDRIARESCEHLQSCMSEHVLLPAAGLYTHMHVQCQRSSPNRERAPRRP